MSWASRADPRVRERVARALNVNAEVVRAEMYTLVQLPPARSGVKYPGLRNRSSAPGEPPAPQSNRLANSIAVIKRATAQDLTADTGPRPQSFPDYYYASVMEYGTRDGRIKQRPYVRPTADKVAKLWRSQGIRVT